jgi:hypothetical protein
VFGPLIDRMPSPIARMRQAHTGRREGVNKHMFDEPPYEASSACAN